MAYVIRGMVDPAKVDQALKKAERALAPDVVRIRYSIKEDWSGEPAVYFRIVLSDHASREDRLRDSTGRVSQQINMQVRPERFGLQPYFNYRSVSEQEQMKDPAWN